MELSPDTLRAAHHALHDYLYETNRYLASNNGKEPPRATDLCCDHHRARYQLAVEMRRDLEQRRTTIETAIAEIGALIPKEDDGPTPEDTTSTNPAALAAEQEI